MLLADLIFARLGQVTAEPNARISYSTEIYKDLHISGADFYDFIDWLHTEFGADFSAMDCSRYVPAEGASLWERQFESCTVGQMVAAVQKGAWS
jgi:hypothetical protein